jgi:hypothetical protein
MSATGWTPVDESALKWTPVDESVPASKPRTFMDSFGDFTREFLGAINPVTAVKGIAQTVSHPVEAYQADKAARDKLVDLTRQSLENASKETDPLKKANHYANAFTYALQSDLPLIGPALQAPAEKIEQGHIAAGLGQASGFAAPEAISGLASNVKIPGTTGIAERMYQSALKPPPGTYSTAEVGQMVKTGLSQGIPVSAAGVEKIGDLVQDLNQQIQGKINAGAASGATVNKFSVASRLGNTAQRFATQVNPEADLSAIGTSGNEFIRNQPTQIPVDTAQALKSGTYQQLGSKAYGEIGSATREAQKALARGLKEELQKQFPEIQNLNAQEGKLINLDEALQRAVRRIDNHDIISLGSTVATGAGAAIGGAGGAASLFFLKKAIEDPLVKSRLAIALNRGGLGVNESLARVAAYSNALGNAISATAPDSGNQTAPASP